MSGEREDVFYMKFLTTALANAKKLLTVNVSHKRTSWNDSAGRYQKDDIQGNYLGEITPHPDTLNLTCVVFGRRSCIPPELLIGEILLTRREAIEQGYPVP